MGPIPGERYNACHPARPGVASPTTMRHIGSLRDQGQARLFGEFLVARHIRNEVDAENDGTWSVWIRDEDQVPDAQELFARFQANPNAPEFQRAPDEAARVRKAEAEDLAKFRQRIRTRRSIFPKIGNYGVGVLTYILIIASVVVTLFCRTILPDQKENAELLHRLFISEPGTPAAGFLPEVMNGEVWRLFTPIFIHLSALHLLFNMMWLYQLGCMIEARRGIGLLAGLVAVSALLSNLAQYYMQRHHFVGFGGMSGVVYALLGYAWICGRYFPASSVALYPNTVITMLIWLVVCYTGMVGPIANTAHVVGLIVGMAWGRISAYRALRKPD
jgi:GlpG protein